MTLSPELPSRLSGDPAEFAAAATGMQAADVAEALGDFAPQAAGRVIAALPFDLAVEVLDDPELEDRVSIIRSMDPGTAAALLDAMSADQQAIVFRDLPDPDRARLCRRSADRRRRL